MKPIAIVSLVILSLWSAEKAVEMCRICVCGNCGWMLNLWALFHVAVIVLAVLSIAQMRTQNPRAMGISLAFTGAILAIEIFGAAMYVVMIMAGQDYFDPLLFIPLGLASAGTGCVALLMHRARKQKVSQGADTTRPSGT